LLLNVLTWMSIHTSGLWILKAVLAWWYWLCSFWRGFFLSGSLNNKSYWHQSYKCIIYTRKFRLHIILLWCIGKGISQYNEVQIQLIWYFAVLIHSDQAFVNSKQLKRVSAYLYIEHTSMTFMPINLYQCCAEWEAEIVYLQPQVLLQCIQQHAERSEGTAARTFS